MGAHRTFIFFFSLALAQQVMCGKLRRAHEPRKPVAASQPAVQALAAFAVEEFISHRFRTKEYHSGARFDVLRAEKIVNEHPENPALTAKNYFLTIRLYLDECAVHFTHVVLYSASHTKIVNSREIDDHHPECSGVGPNNPPPSSSSGRFISPLLKSLEQNGFHRTATT